MRRKVNFDSNSVPNTYQNSHRHSDHSLVYPSIINRLTELLEQWEPNQILPSERELSQTFRVHRDTVRRALAVLEEKGRITKLPNGRRVVSYLPSTQEQSLINCSLVLFFSEEIQTNLGLDAGWHVNIAIGAINRALQLGLNLLVLSPINFNQKNISSLSPGGMILDLGIQGKMREIALHWLNKGVPSIGLEERLHPQMDVVKSNHWYGAYELGKLLTRYGRKKLLVIQGSRHSAKAEWWQNRLQGYRYAMEEGGGQIVNILNTQEFDEIHFNPDIQSKFSIQEKIMTGILAPYLYPHQKIDAIATVSDYYVPYAAFACENLGYRVHEDIAIVGYDHYWHRCFEYLTAERKPVPPLATVDKQNLAIGMTLVEKLWERISGQYSGPGRDHLINPQIIVTSTCTLR